MLLGQAGLLSFGHAIYFGLAGYASIHILSAINDSYLPSLPLILLPFIGAFVGLMLGICIGYLSTKRIGTAFAMISLGFCELVTALTLIFVVFFNQIIPDLNYSLFVIAGMSAVTSCVIGGPISTLLIVFELTSDYQVALGAGISVCFSNLISSSKDITSSLFPLPD